MYIEIEFDRLERDVLQASIKDADVQKLLPFQTVLKRGDEYVHIVNRSAYTVETNSHLIPEGAALCARKEMFRPLADFTFTENGSVGMVRINQHRTASCPGCLVKAKTVIVNYLLKQEQEL